jgi:lipopolysaccharide export system protein LptA
MQRSDGERGDATRSDAALSVDRRSYLKLAGVAAGSVPLLSGSASAAFTRRGIRFKRTVNMVEEAGCDPTGNQPCDEQITDAAGDYTLLQFPAGTYKLTEKNVILGETNVGFVGEGDVRFKVPERFNEKVLVVDDGTGVLFEGIDIDQTADGATPGLHLGADDNLQVHDVELIGQGIHPDSIPKGEPGWSPGDGASNGNPDVMDYFYPIVRSPDGTGLVTNLEANNHGLMGAYNAGDGRSGIWVGVENKGTITFRDCHIEEFGSNGTYTSRTYGVVQFEGGTYRNNDNNQIRIGSTGSYIDGATLDVDAASSDAPNPYEALNYRGARIEMGRMSDRTDIAIRNSDITIRSSPHSGGGVVAEATASEFRVEDTRIGVDVDGVRGVLGKEPDGGGAYPAPAKPHAGTLRNVSITGSAANHAAITLRNRPDSIMEGSCLHQEGSDRDGAVLINSDGSVVRNSTIDVTGQQVIDRRGWVNTNDLSDNGSCPAPDYSGGSSLPRELSIKSNGGRYSYTFSVSGDLEKRRTADPNDSVSGSTASGQGGGGGTDSYNFSGEIVAFDLDGDATVSLNGQRIDPDRYLDSVLTIEGTGSRAEYTVAVGEELEKTTANGASINPDDNQWRTTSSGYVVGGRDSYTFSGEIAALQTDDSATVYLDGHRIDPDSHPDHVLTVEGPGSRATYTVTTTGDIDPSTANGASINSDDGLRRTTASGYVVGGRDSYAFSGEIAALRSWGDATYRLDGRRISPVDYLNKVVTIKGTGSRAEYVLTSTKTLEKTTVNGASINSDDNLSARTASGYVVGGRDSYALSWTVDQLSIDGDAQVYLDGRRVDPDRFLDTVLTIKGPGSRTEYDFTVDGAVEKSTANGASINPSDRVSGSSAQGFVVSGRDSYVFSGEVTQLVFDGRARITLDRSERTITVEGKQSGATYAFSVSGDVEGISHEPNVRHNDTVHAHGAEGFVHWGSDTYRYTGDLESLEVGDAAVSVER